MRDVDKFSADLKKAYNFTDVKWLGRTIGLGHRFKISLCNQHIELYNSKKELFGQYRFQARTQTLEICQKPINQVSDINTWEDNNQLIIEGPISSIDAFLFYIFGQ